MTTPIRIPDHIEIPHRGDCTPVSMTDAAWIFMQGGGADLLKRIAALEAKSGKHEVIIGSGLEPEPPQPVAIPDGSLPAPPGFKVVSESFGMFKVHPSPQVHYTNGEPTQPQPVADNAALEALRVLSTNGNIAVQDDKGDYIVGWRIAQIILAAIRARKVPGIYWSDDYLNDKQVAIYNEQIAVLRAQLAEADTRMQQLATEARQQCEWKDQALADLAAEQTAHVNTGARCAAIEHTLAALRAELAAERERRETLERRIELFKNECTAVHKERDAANQAVRDAKADAERAKAERNRMEAQWEEMNKAGSIKHLRELTAEANTARAELAAERESLSRAEALRAIACHDRIAAEKQRDTARERAGVLEGLLRRYADRMGAVNGDVGPAFIAELRIDIDAALGKGKP